MEVENLNYPIVPIDFLRQVNVIKLAQDLLGKVLVTQVSGVVTRGLIVETEAYNGIVDKASHAFGGRRTKRNEAMYHPGGIAYVYLCYGIHRLFNVVTSVENDPKAVLIRGIIPLDNQEIVLQRRNQTIMKPNIGIGPGKVSECLGIQLEHNFKELTGSEIWIEEYGITPLQNELLIGPRIGVDYAGEDALLPYRFRWIKKLNNYF